MRPDTDYNRLRAHMVETHLAKRGIRDPLVLKAFETVPREQFVLDEFAPMAYEDEPLPIGKGQTISQPYIVAVMAEALELKPSDRVLEIGTGSGYAAAIFSRLAKKVISIERIEDHADEAAERLAQLDYANVTVLMGDGTLGWSDMAPYNAIAVAAGATVIPTALLVQLAIGGRLVIPVGPNANSQTLVRVRRESETQFHEEPITRVRFVPLIADKPQSN